MIGQVNSGSKTSIKFEFPADLDLIALAYHLGTRASNNFILEDFATPATVVWVSEQMHFVLVAVDIEDVSLALPFVVDPDQH